MQEREIAIIIGYPVDPESRARFPERPGANGANTPADDGWRRMGTNEPAGADGRTVVPAGRRRDPAAIDRHRARPGHDASPVRVDEPVARRRAARCRGISG